jgi:serine/threonine-protein kinase
MVGQTVGHYRVLEKLGEGGMGVVYLAEDAALKRKVALKVLPEQFTQDRERLARFQREAQVLASLSDPRIAAIYGLEELDGQQILVLELAEGETLDEKIKRGPLPVDDALEIALQIAEGLEAAHEKGIIHRDLKPANVMVSSEGKVKILDFGLAKAFEGETSVAEMSHSPTITHEMTRPGVILGTAAYMSPEQARGKKVDKRADIWAFGCVLYEMLTSRKAFQGEAITDVLAKILERGPDWKLLPDNVPRRIRELLTRCLRKDPQERLRDIGDARIVILEADVKDLEKATSEPYRAGWLPWVISLASLVLAVVFLFLWLSSDEKPTDRLPILTNINLPPEAPLAPAGVMPFGMGKSTLTISPDGRNLVYVALTGSKTQLYRRDMTNGEVKPVAGTEGAHNPVFSPDSKWIAFFSGEKLRKVALSGGDPIPLTDVASLDGGAAWGPDNWIYFNPNEGEGIWRVSPDGTDLVSCTEPRPGTIMHGWPGVLPLNRGLLVALNAWEAVMVTAGKPKSTLRPVVKNASFPRYAPTGHLVYATKGRLAAVAFDLETLKVKGSPVVLFDYLRTETSGAAQFSFSSDGTLVLVSGEHQDMGDFIWLNRDGQREPLDLSRRSYGDFKLSPDERYLALTVYDDWRQNIFVHDFETKVEQALTADGINLNPVWSPDGRSITHTHRTEEGPELWSRPIDASWEPLKLTTGFNPWCPLSENEILVASENEVAVVATGWSGDASSAGDTEVMRTGSFGFPALSPDGRWLAYTDWTGEQKRWEIYVSPWPSLDRKFQISMGGGEEPRWHPNGNEIIYRSVQAGIPKPGTECWGTQWLSVDVEFEPEFRASSPEVLFEGPYINLMGYSWDISNDGERFLLIENVEHQSEPVTELVIVSNFFDMLREKVPTDN